MYEIDGPHIALLSDADLRALVVRLCEAELRRAGLPVSAITAGGDQDAPDGGIDVRVELPQTARPNGFIPRPQTGFQVKKPAMPAKKITAEMRPKGELRPAIKALAACSGAYILVSGKANATDASLTEIHTAMRGALADLADADQLAVDFYDRDRLARCVRDHHGLIAWVRERIGQPIQGWQSFGDWSKSGAAASAYLLDETARLHDLRNRREEGLAVAQGIQRIREILNRPHGTVRLVGLSGTGKTRLLEALFDERIGQGALDPALAHYADEAESPTPTPSQLLRRLIQEERRAIVIIDNCLPATHRALAAICAEAASRLSLITVEFDVGEDEPEHTDGLFRLESASPEVIERLIESRYPDVSQANRHRIAELAISGGNARMALALARTVEHGENLARLTDKSLFERLFHQRQQPDKVLLRAAQACSLVYSFEGEAMAGDGAELPVLAGLARMSAEELHEHVAELYRRGLVQKRGRWRAVLPQALALWLASRALEDFPLDRIETAMRNGPPRLLQSFSRQLGCLHDSEGARKIVRGWLSPGGYLANPENLDPFGMANMFRNIAPVLPEMTLICLERSADENREKLLDPEGLVRSTWISIIEYLAYDAVFFDRAATLLARFAYAETNGRKYNSAQNSFKRLFQLYLSGTHARIEQRLNFLESLCATLKNPEQNLAMEAFDAVLITDHFSADGDLGFGARPRDYGWHPTTYEEIDSWYRSAFDFANRLARSSQSNHEKLRPVMARRFNSLWSHTDSPDELSDVIKNIDASGFWPEGWIAIRTALLSPDESDTPPYREKLQELERFLAPTDLLQRVRVYVFSDPWRYFDALDENYDQENPTKSYDAALVTIENLGCEVAKEPEVLDKIISELFVSTHSSLDSAYAFGRGLAMVANNIAIIWNRFVQGIRVVGYEKLDITVMRGFLEAASERNAKQADKFLDAAISCPTLGRLFPALQTAVGINEIGEKRLEISLNVGLAPAWTYSALGSQTISPVMLCKIINHISLLSDGLPYAIHMLYMRLVSYKHRGCADINIIQCGRNLLAMSEYNWQGYNLRDSHELTRIADTCLIGEDAAELATLICRKISLANRGYLINFSEYSGMLKSLFRNQTEIALNELIGNDTKKRFCISEDDLNRENPLKSVSDETLLNWAKADPEIRCRSLASKIPLFQKGEQPTDRKWSDIALKLLELAPDKASVLEEYGRRFGPFGCYRGSRADIWERYRVYAQALFSYPDSQVSNWAYQEDAYIARIVEQERAEERITDERFE